MIYIHVYITIYIHKAAMYEYSLIGKFLFSEYFHVLVENFIYLFG